VTKAKKRQKPTRNRVSCFGVGITRGKLRGRRNWEQGNRGDVTGLGI